MPSPYVLKHGSFTIEHIVANFPETGMAEVKYRRFASTFLVPRNELRMCRRDILLIGQVTRESIARFASTVRLAS